MPSTIASYNDEKGFTEYQIKTGDAQASRRFSDFVNLHSKIKDEVPNAPQFPASKKLFNGKAVKEDRQAKFEAYLNDLAAAAGDKAPRELARFLGLVEDTEMEYGVLDQENILWNKKMAGACVDRPAGSQATTCYTLMQEAIAKYSTQAAVGKRPLLKRHYEVHGGKEVEKLELGAAFEWTCFADYGKAMAELGAGMVGFAGLQPGERIVIYAETQMEWMLAAQAAWTQALQVVTVYATLGVDGLAHGTAQTEAKLIVADAKLLKVLAAAAKSHAAQLASCSKVAYIADPVRAPDEKAAAALAEAIEALRAVGIETVELGELRQRGAEAPLPAREPMPSDVAVVMYTSGTTGLPKGVLISHANVVAAAASIHAFLSDPNLPKDATECYLAYLPLAHIMEMAAEIGNLSLGAAVGYGSPHTLTPTGVKIKAGTCEGDAAVLRPTFMVFAPAVLDKVYAGLKAKIAAASPTVQRLFAAGVASGEANFERGVVGAPWLYNALVFKKVQALLGGRVRLMITGSAPLAPGIQKFVQSVFNCPVRQGYGLTETCAASCVALAADNSVSVVGPPTPSACIMLRDWVEGNCAPPSLTARPEVPAAPASSAWTRAREFLEQACSPFASDRSIPPRLLTPSGTAAACAPADLTADKLNPEVGMPRGEILIGGPAVCQGYLVDAKSPDPDVVKKNQEEFVVDARGRRWFCTGDIGQVTPAGNVQIIDRKKDLVKLQQGEYVALSKVENALKQCPLVELPMCYGRSTESYCVALVCPLPAALKALGAELGLDSSLDHAALCAEPAVLAELSKRCAAACKTAKLAGFEVPKRIGLVADAWTPENDLLTAAMKLKRVPIVARHKAQLDSLYSPVTKVRSIFVGDDRNG